MNSLEGSIKKWEKIVAGKGYDHGTLNCPLCREFMSDNCDGCPVQEATGEPGCEGTPYDEWNWHFNDLPVPVGPDRRVTDETTRALAQAELDFLRSLRGRTA
jgi:hypothetical protein